jgi:hypothetical protein
MKSTNLKSVLIGVGAAAAVISLTAAASGMGVGGVFNLGKANKVNATSGLTGSTRHPMLSVTNSGSGTALSLQVAKGKAPFSVSSSAQVSKLNASLLGGLTAGQFVQGGGQSRSFGFSMPTATAAQRKVLSVPGFGTLNAFCETSSGGFAQLSFATGSHAMDKFVAAVTDSDTSVGNTDLTPHAIFLVAQVQSTSTTSIWEQQILRYVTGSGGAQRTHMATLDVMVDVTSTTCDFDASESTSVAGP